MNGLGIAGVSVRYGSSTAVDDVRLSVAPGEIVALLGPSGCGKSSLLRAVAGLEPLAGGDVTWDDESVARVPVHLRGFGLVFQDGQLFTHRDVAGNVAYGVAGADRAGAVSRTGRPGRSGRAARVDELLDLVGLTGYGPRPVATLSGGERQRVALARALAPAPRLLLLDEPLSALDRALRERLAVDLRAVLVATGTTALFVTHDQDEAFAVADRVAVMSRGALLQVDAPADLWRAPASREVARFLGYEAFVRASSAPVLADALRARRAIPGARGTGGPGPAVVSADRDVPGLADRDAPRVHGFAPGADPELALAEGAFVVARGDDEAVAKGTVLATTSRRGRTEVRVEVDGIGAVTALAPAGTTADPGDVVPLTVDPDALTTLP
ncbi:ABC transporter ATP-binding protein [Cellulomonas sp. HZM]|uniref:ABC transporter ATP-binding protein n=1 Tax=Cellulomonas sp. HZM TaxID=1454010 RepID=UPI0009DFDB6B|nr:ABC transporter ATP-binding protein [Cellulomonas sp. HZM]